MSRSRAPSGLVRTVGTRPRLLLAIVLAGLSALLLLSPWLGPLWPRAPGLAIAGDFLAAAVRPALWSEDPTFRAEVGPLPLAALAAAWRTIAFAVSAMAIAQAAALPLGVLASEAFWQSRALGRRFERRVGGAARVIVRFGLTFARSVHELLWAVILLAAVGLTEASAVIAIAIPFTGVLAKLFAEMVDESPRDAALALDAIGASPTATFLVGLVPRALPDMASYAYYRFECALRSSAVLGFFGFPTLGLSIKQSFENLHYREVWTYLWTMFVLIGLVEWWSGVLRRRLVG